MHSLDLQQPWPVQPLHWRSNATFLTATKSLRTQRAIRTPWCLLVAMITRLAFRMDFVSLIHTTLSKRVYIAGRVQMRVGNQATAQGNVSVNMHSPDSVIESCSTDFLQMSTTTGFQYTVATRPALTLTAAMTAATARPTLDSRSLPSHNHRLTYIP